MVLSLLFAARPSHPSTVVVRRCVGEGLVSGPHLLGESAQGIYYLTSGKLKGSRNCLRLMRNERRKVKVMKRSRKSEETLTSCMDEMRQTLGHLEPFDVRKGMSVTSQDYED